MKRVRERAAERARERACLPPSPFDLSPASALLLLLIHANTHSERQLRVASVLLCQCMLTNYHRYSSLTAIPVRPSTQRAAFHCLPTVSTHLDYCHAPCPRRAIIRARWRRTGARYDPIHSLGCPRLSLVLTSASYCCRPRGCLCLVLRLMHPRRQ